MTEEDILQIIISHAEPVTMLDGIIHSNDFKDLAKEIYEAINKEDKEVEEIKRISKEFWDSCITKEDQSTTLKLAEDLELKDKEQE